MSGRWTLAVDYGTTSTVTAMADASGNVEVLEVDGYRKIPSMIVVDEDGTIVVGAAAAGLARSMPHRTIRTPKNRLGDQVPVVVGGTPYQPLSFVKAVLEHVLEEAIRFHGSPPAKSRLTYPATWNRPKRTRLLEAAAKAGFPEPELVSEPIAAALTHAHVEALAIGDHVAVYDLGGGTFDTVVLLRTTTGFSVVGDALGDQQLGGELFDEILMNHVGEQIDTEQWEQLLVSEEPEWTRAAVRLRSECKRAKEALSMHPHAEVSVGLPSGSIAVGIARDELSELITPYVEESIELLGRCMADAGQDGDSISAIYVTGGASRMPLVEELVRQAYPNTAVSRRGDPKVAVALGALRADEASLDTTTRRTSNRTTEEDGLSSAEQPALPVPPAPPVVDVPSGPETRVATVVDTPEAEPASTPLGEGTSIQQEPLHAVIASDEAATSGDSRSLSPALIGASFIGVLALGAALVFLLLPALGNEDTPVIAGETTTSTSTSTTSVTVAEPPLTEETVIEDTEPDDAAPPTFESAQFLPDELGFGWQYLTQEDAEGEKVVVDTVNLNLCQVSESSTSVEESLASFDSESPPAQLTSKVQRFATEEDIIAALKFTSELASLCPAPEIPLVGDDVLTGEVVPLRGGADQDERVGFPTSVDAVATLAYKFTNPEFPSEQPHMLVTQLRVGDTLGSLVFFTPGLPSEAHIEFLTRLMALQAERLEALQ